MSVWNPEAVIARMKAERAEAFVLLEMSRSDWHRMQSTQRDALMRVAPPIFPADTLEAVVRFGPFERTGIAAMRLWELTARAGVRLTEIVQ